MHANSAVAADAQLSLNNTWYAVAHRSQLLADQVFAMRLLGEPIVLYRDAQSEAVCVRDVCPHRSAPLSMGEMEDGVLRCFYHGWAFGAGGGCVDVPTVRLEGKTPNFSTFSCTTYAVVEHAGMVWVWKGSPLLADARKLPSLPAADDPNMFTVETTLDYGVDWPLVAAANLGAPYLHPMLEGESPDLAALLGGTAPQRLKVRSPQVATHFHAPAIVRHQSASGCLEVTHVVPIATGRTRVLVRQHFRRSGALGVLLNVPGAAAVLSSLVRNWNYDVSELDVADDEQQQQSPSAQDDAIVARFWDWHARMLATESEPYFTRWGDRTAYSSSLGRQEADSQVGTYGLKRNYVQENPKPEFAPLRRR